MDIPAIPKVKPYSIDDKLIAGYKAISTVVLEKAISREEMESILPAVRDAVLADVLDLLNPKLSQFEEALLSLEKRAEILQENIDAVHHNTNLSIEAKYQAVMDIQQKGFAELASIVKTLPIPQLTLPARKTVTEKSILYSDNGLPATIVEKSTEQDA